MASDRSANRRYARADDAARAVRLLPPRGALAQAMREVRRDEICASAALAGSELSAAEVDALLDRGIAQGDHPFDQYVLVRAYADAAASIADARPRPHGDRRSLLSVEELRQLNTRATAGSSRRGGAWRQGNLAPEAGIVAPAAWLVAREVTALVDRFGRGPGELPVALWLARFIGRLARLRPFEDANGRTARLASNLMLARLDYPPLVPNKRDRARLPAALATAETTDVQPLATLFATAIVRTCNRLIAVATMSESLVALRIAAGVEYSALAKAAQRGRLRTIVRGGRYFTTTNWIAEYRAAVKRPSAPAGPADRSRSEHSHSGHRDDVAESVPRDQR